MLGGLNDDDLEDALLIGLGEPRECGYMHSSKYSRIDLNTFTDAEFHQKFRFKREIFEELCHGLRIPGQIQLRNRYSTTGIEGLATLLRRMAYPNRWCDLESLFGLSSSYLSAISSHVMQIIIEKKGHLLNLGHAAWLNEEKIEDYADAVHHAGAPLKNCWGFIGRRSGAPKTNSADEVLMSSFSAARIPSRTVDSTSDHRVVAWPITAAFSCRWNLSTILFD
ncbi:hypothetical protein JTE90_015718 [Oedothorax gibbosus]|uniref:Uncharacterized protein n=1 Tax=Oedothorax gibbosus TaxID=931172 RepID=A0AAV6TZ59_9ARAC|nr:hypothetical protein JTE90_015718 [Oedothorax gibbosus]